MSTIQIISNIAGVVFVLSLLALCLFMFIFWVLMLIDALKRDMDTGTKIAWVLVLLFVHFLGAVIYYFVVKRNAPTLMTSVPQTSPSASTSNSAASNT